MFDPMHEGYFNGYGHGRYRDEPPIIPRWKEDVDVGAGVGIGRDIGTVRENR